MPSVLCDTSVADASVLRHLLSQEPIRVRIRNVWHGTVIVIHHYAVPMLGSAARNGPHHFQVPGTDVKLPAAVQGGLLHMHLMTRILIHSHLQLSPPPRILAAGHWRVVKHHGPERVPTAAPLPIVDILHRDQPADTLRLCAPECRNGSCASHY